MATEPQPSFSRRRKWSIGLDVLVRTVVVLAVVIMVNYLSGQYFRRFFLSSQTQIALSSQTISVLKSLTNQVKVTLYYDKEDPLYATLLALLGLDHEQLTYPHGGREYRLTDLKGNVVPGIIA